MAKKVTEKKSTSAQKEVGEIVSRSEKFIENNKKNITYGLIALAVAIGAVMGYNQLYRIPNNNNAAVALFKGQFYFEMDSFYLAVNGNGFDFDGFDQISKQYSGTKSGNLAKAYAGICYYKLGDMESAIHFLKSFKSKEDNIAPAIIGRIGDCFVEMGDVEQGITYFERAASKANNDLLSPIFLKKAGIAYEHLKQYEHAIKAYTTIKEKHAASIEAMDIDKDIVRVQLANE